MNEQIQRNRSLIDAIDKQLVELLNKRVLHDGGADEKTVLDKIAQFNSGPLSDETVQAIYRTLMIAGFNPLAASKKAAFTDKIDSKIVQLLNERVKYASEIGKIKFANGADYYDPKREAEVMAKIALLNTGPITNNTLRSVYREVISGSIALEKCLTIAYLGPESTYTHLAAIRNFGVSLKYRAIRTISDVFADVETGNADYGVIPIENSTEGVVFHSMDMLVGSDLQICSQIYLTIEHCLISQSSLEEITEVHSKDQALGQCRNWLQVNLPDVKLVETESTAEAVRLAQKNPSLAAVASELSAKHYGVPVQGRGIQDCDDNMTRFLVIGKTRVKPLGNGMDKTSLVISLKDEPGALEKMLQPFGSRGINLSKIESRPSRKKAWEYLFFIDFVGHYEDLLVQDAISELQARCSYIKWLGSYPNTAD